MAALPAVNLPKKTSAPASGAPVKLTTTDQLAALSKFSSKLAKIDVPYVMGVGVNRKGPSSYANAKDKADRATNEQVLDPRTRLILLKMIGRGLINEVNGCVSTGKEVSVHIWIVWTTGRSSPIGECIPRFNSGIRTFGTENLQNIYPDIQRQR